MNTKKSLGHFALGSDYSENSELSFIPNINGDHEETNTQGSLRSLFEATASDRARRREHLETEDAFSSELVERDVPNTEEEAEPVKKKVVSYYLEESIIERLKAYSEAINSTYSGVASDAIESYILDRGF
jgi:hypothetical protein